MTLPTSLLCKMITLSTPLDAERHMLITKASRPKYSTEKLFWMAFKFLGLLVRIVTTKLNAEQTKERKRDNERQTRRYLLCRPEPRDRLGAGGITPRPDCAKRHRQPIQPNRNSSGNYFTNEQGKAPHTHRYICRRGRSRKGFGHSLGTDPHAG